MIRLRSGWISSIALLASLLRVAAQDTTIVRADNRAVWNSPVRLQRELRIGAVEGAEEYSFGVITGLAVAPDGSIFVLNAQVPCVREYDAAGNYRRTFGRRGQGPGELAQPEAVALAGDRIVVRDSRNGRFVLFPLRAGEPQHWTYQRYSYSLSPITVHDNGGISTPFQLPPRPNDTRSAPAILRYRSDGISDTLPVPSFGPPPAQLNVRSASGSARYSIPYLPAAVWSYAPDGAVIGGIPDRYSLIRIQSGRITRIDRTGVARVAVSEEERSSLRGKLERQLRSSAPDYRWSGPGIPTVKPYYKRIVVDQDQRIWVQLHAASRKVAATAPDQEPQWTEAPVFDVYSSVGQYLGQVQFPNDFVFHYARGNQAWGVERGDLGVSYVARYRLLGV